jgi:hypothetical protein
VQISVVPLLCLVWKIVLLVPRISSTPVAMWSWPTWVVESETCFDSHVHLVGVFISFEYNFYRLSFTPPLLSPIRSFMVPSWWFSWW